MNIFLIVLLFLLLLSLLCATLIIAATVNSSRAFQKLAHNDPAIYGEEALAKAHQKSAAQQKETAVSADSTQLLAP